MLFLKLKCYSLKMLLFPKIGVLPPKMDCYSLNLEYYSLKFIPSINTYLAVVSGVGDVPTGAPGEGGSDGDNGAGSDFVRVVVVFNPNVDVHFQRRKSLEHVDHFREFLVIQLQFYFIETRNFQNFTKFVFTMLF